MTPLRVGLVGTGFIADFHLAGFAAQTDVRITALCALSDRERRDVLCQKWHLTPYETFEALVTSPDVDAVLIASRNPEHFAQARRALELGKSVLVEKPVVTELSQLEELEHVARVHGALLMPAHNCVYRPELAAAKARLDSGDLGTLAYAQLLSSHTISDAHAQAWRARAALSSGGALMDSGHHQVYQAVYLFGAPIQVQAFTSRLVRTSMDGEDLALVSLRYASGLLVSVVQSWTSDHAGSLNGIRVFGHAGALEVTDFDYAASFAQQARAFADAVHHGAPPRSTLDDARTTLKIIQAAYRSAAMNTTITL